MIDVYKRQVHNWARILESHDINSDLHKSNPNYKEGFEWQINCQRCVPTYEMRKMCIRDRYI